MDDKDDQDDNKKSTQQDEYVEQLMAMKAVAVRQATFEIVAEQRAEIVKRARAKLVAMGVPFGDMEDV